METSLLLDDPEPSFRVPAREDVAIVGDGAPSAVVDDEEARPLVGSSHALTDDVEHHRRQPNIAHGIVLDVSIDELLEMEHERQPRALNPLDRGSDDEADLEVGRGEKYENAPTRRIQPFKKGPHGNGILWHGVATGSWRKCGGGRIVGHGHLEGER